GDTETGQQLAEFSGHKGRVSALAFSPDGTLLATAGYGSVAFLWDLRTGQVVRRFEGHATKMINDVRFSADGRRLVTAGEDHTARVWEVGPRKELARLCAHTGPVRVAYFL